MANAARRGREICVSRLAFRVFPPLSEALGTLDEDTDLMPLTDNCLFEQSRSQFRKLYVAVLSHDRQLFVQLGNDERSHFFTANAHLCSHTSTKEIRPMQHAIDAELLFNLDRPFGLHDSLAGLPHADQAPRDFQPLGDLFL